MEKFCIWSIVQFGIFVGLFFSLGQFRQKLVEIWFLKVGLFSCKMGGCPKLYDAAL
jgi:hypothetical protein